MQERIDLLFPQERSGTWGTGRLADALVVADTPGGGERSHAAAKLARMAKGSTAAVLRLLYSQEEGQRRARRNPARIADYLERRWGPEFLEPAKTLERLRGDLPPVCLINFDLAKWLAQRSKISGMTWDRWRQAQTFGVLSDVYVRDMTAYLKKLSQDSPEKKALRSAIFGVVDQSSMAAVKAAGDRDTEGWLALNVHNGPFRFGKWVRNSVILSGRIFIIGAGQGKAKKRQYASVTQDPIRALMLLVKHLRIPGNIGGMGLDGEHATSGHQIDICGQPLTLAFGPPHAIFHSKSRNSMFRYGWRDGKLVLDMWDGPRPEPGERIEDWTARWYAAVRPVLEDMVTGDPHNIRGFSGIWSKLLAQLRASKSD